MREYHPEVNADCVWVNLCWGDATAIQYCKAFLQLYVDNSTHTRVVLGPEEEVEEKAIKSSRSLNAFWKSLLQRPMPRSCCPAGKPLRTTRWR